MDWLQYVIAAIFFVLGAGCVASIIFNLPGTWMLLGLAAIVEYCDRFYLPAEGPRQTFAWWLLGTCLALAVLGEALDWISGAAGARKGGASKRGMIGAFIGGIVGALFLGGVFFFLPVIGVLLGALLGTFIGAVIGELSAERATLRGSMKPAIGATIGRAVGTIGKIGVAIAMWLALGVAAFWP